MLSGEKIKYSPYDTNSHVNISLSKTTKRRELCSSIYMKRLVGFGSAAVCKDPLN